MRKVFLVILVSSGLFAHTPLLTCMDEGDGTVTCEGGFSDGSSAGGVNFIVKQGEKILIEKKLNSISEINFKKPSGEYVAIFDAGNEHRVYLKSSEIFE